MFHVYSSINKVEDKKLYKIAITFLKTPMVNEKIKELCTAIYIITPMEQIAYANSLDDKLQKDKNLLANQTQEYNYLLLLKYVVKNYNEYNKYVSLVFKKTPEYIFKKINNGYKEFLRKIGRIMIKNNRNK